jgi:hypothetical protein
MNKPTDVVVLCEDDLTFQFTKRYLNRSGITGIRPKISPKGCGYDFVINEFANEVLAYKIANARKNTWLIAVVDADTGTVAQRLGQMDKAQDNSNDQRVKGMRIESERIARMIPRRNIETWLLALNNVSVNEELNYKSEVAEFRHYDWPGSIRTASLTLFDLSRPNVEKPKKLIESLCHAIDEMRRVFDLAR